MDKLLQAIIAFFTALSAALGGPVDSSNIPDRPAIVAPTPESTEIEIGGVVQSVQNGSILVNGITVYVNQQTEIKGQLQVGARVQVEAVKRANEIYAREIHVTGDAGNSQASSSRSSTSSSSRPSSGSSSSQSSKSSSASSSSESSKSSSSSASSSSESSKSSSSSASSSSESSKSSSSSASSSSESSKSSSSESSRESSRSSSSSSSSSSK